MRRTNHLTQADAANNLRPTRARAKTRLTKLGDRLYFGNTDRPKNDGNAWRPGYNAGRLERRRLDRSLLP
jgi:hypothetical protein